MKSNISHSFSTINIKSRPSRDNFINFAWQQIVSHDHRIKHRRASKFMQAPLFLSLPLSLYIYIKDMIVNLFPAQFPKTISKKDGQIIPFDLERKPQWIYLNLIIANCQNFLQTKKNINLPYKKKNVIRY